MPGPRRRLREITLRFFERLLLGGWIGSWASFGLVVAPTAFDVLPSTELAGKLVGPVVSALHLYGLLAGALLALLAWRLGRGAVQVSLALVAAALCAYTEFVVTPQIAEIRPLAFGPEGSPEIASRFRYLHQVSVAIFLLVGLSTLALLAAQVRSDLVRSEGDPP